MGFLLAGLGSAQAVSFNAYENWVGAPNGNQALPIGDKLVSTGGDVVVTFFGPTGAYYKDSVFLASPGGPSGDFFQNHSTAKGAAIDLGYYDPGTVIIVGLHVADSGETYYTGSGDGNPDGAVHAYVQNDWQGITGLTYVGFEDMYANLPADWGYVDEVFAVTGAVGSVPEPVSTISLLGFSLGALMILKRRIKTS